MSDYTQVVDYSAKDALSSGDPNKLVKGSDVDSDLSAISTAIATKYDSNDLASQAQAQAGSDNTVLMTPLRAEEHVAAYVAENGGMLLDIHALADPNADTVLGWDDSAGAVIGYTLHASILHSGTELSVDHDAATNFVANEHIDHSAVSVTAGTGLSGGGTIAATRTLNLSHLGIESLADPNADRILFWDDSAGASAWLTLGTGLSISTTTISAATASTSTVGAVELATSTETYTGTDTSRAVTADAIADTIFSLHIDVPNGGPAAVTKASPGASGWSASRTAEGTITVTHNLGLSSANDMIVVVCPGERSAGNAISAAVDSLGTNSFVVSTINASAIDSDADVLLVCHRVA
jgi:hypothetical protein